MGTLRNILFAVITLAIAFSYQSYRNLSKPHERPDLGILKKPESISQNFQYSD
jgi:hypothetical protein